MIVSKGSAYSLTHFKASVLSQKFDFGRRKRVVLWKLKHAMIETSREIFLKIKQAKMEIEIVDSSD